MLIDHIHYKLGTSFEENNIDLTYLSSHKHWGNCYVSRRYSELYLFNNIFESKCYLKFKNDKLFKIEYKFDLTYFDFFYDSINDDLPNNMKLWKNPLTNDNNASYLSYFENYAIGLTKYPYYFKLNFYDVDKSIYQDN